MDCSYIYIIPVYINAIMCEASVHCLCPKISYTQLSLYVYELMGNHIRCHGIDELRIPYYKTWVYTDNFFVVGGGGGGGACVATPNSVTTPTYYWIATVAVML